MGWYAVIWETIPQPPEKIGHIIGSDLVSYDDNWNIRRIPIKCENCGDNNYYTLNVRFSKFRFMFIPMGKCDHEYFITCPKCGEYKLELEEQEYDELVKYNLVHEHLTFEP